MAFIGAVAVSCYVIPVVVWASLMKFSPFISRRVYIIHSVSSTLVLWTFLLTGFTLFENRRTLRRAGRSYGTAAVFAAAISIATLMFRQVVALALNIALNGRSWIFDSVRDIFGWDYYTILTEAPATMCATILAVWSILAITRVGRRPADGLEVFNVCFASFCLLWGLLLVVLLSDVSWSWSWLDQKIG